MTQRYWPCFATLWQTLGILWYRGSVSCHSSCGSCMILLFQALCERGNSVIWTLWRAGSTNDSLRTNMAAVHSVSVKSLSMTCLAIRTAALYDAKIVFNAPRCNMGFYLLTNCLVRMGTGSEFHSTTFPSPGSNLRINQSTTTCSRAHPPPELFLHQTNLW